MSRRNTLGTVKQYLGKDLPGVIQKMSINRANLLAPLPMPLDKLWGYLWSEREEQALRILMKECPKALDRDWDFFVGKHWNPKIEQHVRASIQIAEGWPTARREVDINIMPEEVRGNYLEWEATRYRLTQQGDDLIAKVRKLEDVCTTYGQLNRLWPDLLSLFNQKGRTVVEAARVKSKLHPNCYLWEATDEKRWDGKAIQRNTGMLREEWLPAAFVKHTEFIAECLMLPAADENMPSITIMLAR